MNVHHTIDLGEGHLIEIGDATWDPAKKSIRNCYSTTEGGSSSQSSSEIPLKDLAPMLRAVADCDLMDVATAAELIKSLAASVARRSGTAGPRPTLDQLVGQITDENRHTETDFGTPVGKEVW